MVHSTASVIPAVLKPFLIISGCLQRYSYTSTINCACSGLSSEGANDTLTSAGFIPLTSCFVTSSTNQALYLLPINNLNRFIDCYFKWFKLVCEIVWNDNNMTKNFPDTNPLLLCCLCLLCCPLNMSIMINVLWDDSRFP